MSKLIEFSVILLLLTLLVGCSIPLSMPHPVGTPSPAAATSGIEGTIILGPTCPVQRPGQVCERPYQATVLIEDAASGQLTQQVQSDSAGRFRVPLPPGTYRLVGQNLQQGGYPVAHPVEVTVPANQFIAVQVQFDTGIR